MEGLLEDNFALPIVLDLVCGMNHHWGGVSPVQFSYLAGSPLYHQLYLQSGNQVMQGVSPVGTRPHNAILHAVPHEVDMVGVGHLAEQKIDMGSTLELGAARAFKGLQHVNPRLDGCS